MMRRVVFFVLLTMTGTCLWAQSAFGVAGGDASGENGSLNYTVGQVAVMTTYGKVTNASRVAANLREGVQQTYTVEELRIDGVQVLDLDISVYPNPTADQVTVSVGHSVADMRYELYSMDGRLLQKGSVNEGELSIEMRTYAAGSYVMRIAAGKSENNYKIVKL